MDEQAQANLDRLIEMATRADLFVVITFRTGPGRSDFTFYRDGVDWFDKDLLIESVWSDRQAQDAWVEMWRYTAQRYRDNPVVVGYDLMCEPNSNDVALGLYDPGEFYPKYSGSLYDWNQFYPRIVASIREVDAETPILVSAMGWGAVYWLPALQPVNDPRVVYMVLHTAGGWFIATSLWQGMACSLPRAGFAVNSNYAVVKVRLRVMLDKQLEQSLQAEKTG